MFNDLCDLSFTSCVKSQKYDFYQKEMDMKVIQQMHDKKYDFYWL